MDLFLKVSSSFNILRESEFITIAEYLQTVVKWPHGVMMNMEKTYDHTVEEVLKYISLVKFNYMS